MTFDGENRLIVLDTVDSISIKDVYSQWKAWVIQGNNLKYAQAMSVIGGDPINQVQSLGSTFFLENGWKFKPAEANYAVDIIGNLYTRDGASPFIPTTGSYNVITSMTRSNLIDTVSLSGTEPGTVDADSIADAVWNRLLTQINTAGSIGKLIKTMDQKVDDSQARIIAITTTPEV